MWLDARSVNLLEAIDTPSVGALRAALRRLAAVAPRHRVFRRRVGDGTRWEYVGRRELADHCDRMVTAVDADGSDPDDVVTALHRSAPDLPLRFSAGREVFALNLEHWLYDGWTSRRVAAAVLRAAAVGATPTELLAPRTRAPMARALARSWIQDSGALVRTFREPRPAPPPLDEAPGPDCWAGDPSGMVDSGEVPWSPSLRVVSAQGDPDLLPWLRAWRRQNAPTASVATILYAAAGPAFGAVGLPPAAPGVTTLVDNRRYLGPDAYVVGNFAVPVYLAPDDPRDPEAIGRALKASVSSGLPLTTMALYAVHAARHGEDVAPSTRPVRPRVHPILNHMGRLEMFDDLPWRDGGRGARFHALATQGRPEDVTVYFTELAGRLDVNIGFHADVFAPLTIRAVAQMLCTDPLALLP
jgi:hypothetical protein